LTGAHVPGTVGAVALISTGFADLGIPAMLGRGLLPSDAVDGRDPEPVVVLAYRFWRKEFFADRDVVGKTIEFDHKTYRIVGVAPPRFTWYSADVYVPLKLTQDPGQLFVVNVRLRQGVTHDAANAALQPLVEQFAKVLPKSMPEHFRVQVEGLNDWVIERMSLTLYMLFGAVGLLLAIGCGNVSILLLARGAVRQHELALRVALGAHRSRILRQLLTEAALLAVIGVILGVSASYAILSGIRALLPRYTFAPEVEISINLPVLCFSAALALVTGVLFGLWPALTLSATEVNRAIQSSGRRLAGSVHGRRAHDALIAGQIALTLLLLAGAGSAMAAFLRLIHAPLGYDPHNVLSLGLPLQDNSYITWAARGAYFEQLRAKVAETPGVTMTAISRNATPPRNGWNLRFEILGHPAREEQMASINVIGPAYFATLRIPLVQGRIWDEIENRNGAHVAVINRTLARRYFPNGDAIGRSLRLPTFEDRPPTVVAAPKIAEAWLPIVGIVEDARNDGPGNPVIPGIYVPYTLNMWKGTQILVKAAVPPLTLLNAMRAQLAAVNPDQQTYSEVFDLDWWIENQQEWVQERVSAWIFGIFSVLALALAAVGLYSVVSYTVAQRTNEFGIRMALGAQRKDVVRVVFGSSLLSVGGGIVLGLALIFVLNSLLGQWTKGSSREPLVILAGTLMLSLVSGTACAIPSWRATRADPAQALRCE
jgi:predicted permease